MAPLPWRLRWLLPRPWQPIRWPPAPSSPPRTMSEVLAATTPADWRPLDPENTLYLQLPQGRVVIELAPAFAPQHADNLRKLARGKYFDGLAIVRSQDNFVVQWGDPDGKRSLGDGQRQTAARVHGQDDARAALRAAAGPRRLRSRGRVQPGFPRRARPRHGRSMAGPLLRDGRCRPRQRGRQRQRRGTVRGHGPRSAPARPQHCAGGACRKRHGTPGHAAARIRSDGFLRKGRTVRADQECSSSRRTYRRRSARTSKSCAPTPNVFASWSRRGATVATTGTSFRPATSISATYRSSRGPDLSRPDDRQLRGKQSWKESGSSTIRPASRTTSTSRSTPRSST